MKNSNNKTKLTPSIDKIKYNYTDLYSSVVTRTTRGLDCKIYNLIHLSGDILCCRIRCSEIRSYCCLSRKTYRCSD